MTLSFPGLAPFRKFSNCNAILRNSRGISQ